LPLDQSAGNLEGKEVRFGVANSVLWATATTGTSCGAVNSMHDSFNPLGGLVPLVNLKLGEVVFGGVGAGLYGILIFVLLSVFIAGLMVGRTPEYLGKKIEGREMKAVMLYVLVFPLIILSFSAWAAVSPYGVSSLNNAGPHGLSEILYAYTSAAANNGSAFAGLNTNTHFWNTTMGLAMLGGRFLMMVPVLAIAGFMAKKRVAPAGPGTFPTDGPLFTGLLISVILIVGALTFFPALCLGPWSSISWPRTGGCSDEIAQQGAVAIRSGHHPAGGLGQSAKALAGCSGAQSGDVCSRGGQRTDHADGGKGLGGEARRRGPAVVHRLDQRLAVDHGGVRQLRRSGGRGARQGAGRFAAQDAHPDSGPAPA
jgi:hypothetical protein